MSSERAVASAILSAGGSRFVTQPYQWGVVHAVHTAPNTVDVYLDGHTTVATLGIRYLSTYTPTVGDTVLLGRMGSDRWVFGKLA